MESYPQITPAIRARGIYSVRAPFQIIAGVEYTCVAVRTFKDMYNDNIDPYTTVYEPVGLIEGATIDGSIFTMRQEELKGINIISLAAPNGDVIHIPNNFILSVPNTTTIGYEHIVLTCSLGPQPSSVDLTLAIAAIQDAVKDNFGFSPEVSIGRVETTKAVTYEEYLLLEQARINALNIAESPQQLLLAERARNAELTAILQAYSQILIDNNLMPTV